MLLLLISSLFTVYFSLDKYRKENRAGKAEVYSNSLVVIHDAKIFAEENLKGGSEIYRVMDASSFYFSKEAITCLQLYKKEL